MDTDAPLAPGTPRTRRHTPAPALPRQVEARRFATHFPKSRFRPRARDGPLVEAYLRALSSQAHSSFAFHQRNTGSFRHLHASKAAPPLSLTIDRFLFDRIGGNMYAQARCLPREAQALAQARQHASQARFAGQFFGRPVALVLPYAHVAALRQELLLGTAPVAGGRAEMLGLLAGRPVDMPAASPPLTVHLRLGSCLASPLPPGPEEAGYFMFCDHFYFDDPSPRRPGNVPRPGDDDQRPWPGVFPPAGASGPQAPDPGRAAGPVPPGSPAQPAAASPGPAAPTTPPAAGPDLGPPRQARRTPFIPFGGSRDFLRQT
ncbi:hypothetical protein H696_06023 [Fonticula alba]|uniref:Uncharacterized protein n=1 Tax=Fonticula alba TaxID=691883 RepID=A0A058Z0T0_FONAL|nr:hypothetical protein H696_06023 [Fonticula alba]KCV67503.1 hypothetical protein H696_06023 [Fonticula alba]|eukprot:XP_009498064.1 hypothetical protein H696_06023 [Fonticula alba]